MAFLRFTRDKRGYESTFLLQNLRCDRKTRSRVLYWFRTPPDVKVGRAVLDEEAIRLIEDANPGIDIDWANVLQAKPPPRIDPRARPGRRRDKRPESAQAERGGKRPAKPSAAPPELSTLDESPAEAATDADPPPPPSRVHPVEQCIGKEGLARLQARYAELLTRISDQVTEPGQRDARRAEAAALDPDSWVTAGEAVTGIEGFETRVSELRAKLGRRRRSRRGGRRRGGPARSPAPEGTAATAEQGGPDSPSTTVTKPGFEPSESE